MALSLVDSYGSDSEEVEELDDETENGAALKSSTCDGEDDEEEKEEQLLNEGRTRTNYFGTDDANEDSDDSSTSSDDDPRMRRTAKPREGGESSCALALPSAATALGASRVSEIFETMQSQEDAAHEAMLSRHVKLSDTATTTVKSAAPCRAFKRGRCLRGDRCRFSHDIRRLPDSSTPSDPGDAPPPPEAYTSAPIPYNEWEMVEKGATKKRRAGVTDTVLPTKRAAAAFERQKKSQAAAMAAFGAGPK